MNKITYNTEKERCQEPELVETTRIELDQLKVREVSDEIGQECISLRWVMKSKVDDNKPGVKAPLCVRRFEEEQNYRNDSPTCSRKGLRCAFSIIT